MRQSSLLPVVRVVADAGVLYSVTLAAALGCFVQKSNGQYVVLDMVSLAFPPSPFFRLFAPQPLIPLHGLPPRFPDLSIPVGPRGVARTRRPDAR